MLLNLTFVKASQSSNDALFCLVANTFNIPLKVGSLLLHGSGLCGCGLLCVARLLGGFSFLCGLLFGWYVLCCLLFILSLILTQRVLTLQEMHRYFIVYEFLATKQKNRQHLLN